MDATWDKGNALAAVITKNHEEEVMELLYDNCCCALSLAIEKAYMVSYNFPKCKIQVENNCKIVMESLLGLIQCSWRIFSIFEVVYSFVSKMNNNIDLLWCPKDINKYAYEVIKWIA